MANASVDFKPTEPMVVTASQTYRINRVCRAFVVELVHHRIRGDEPRDNAARTMLYTMCCPVARGIVATSRGARILMNRAT